MCCLYLLIVQLLYYIWCLQLHNLTLTESLTDNPCKFAIGSGTVGNWDYYYIMETSSADIKNEWVEKIKKFLLRDLEMMKGVVINIITLITNLISYLQLIT